MKVLLDTNIIIHREASKLYQRDIGQLFFWLDKLKYEKYIHPITVEEIGRYKDSETLSAFNIKLESYNRIKYPAPVVEKVQLLSKSHDKDANDQNDTLLLNELFANRVDIFITEDRKIHRKAALLGIQDRLFSIQSFLEKAIAENPELQSYKVLAVKKVDFGQVNLQDSFFDSFREDYPGFDAWFNGKANEPCYVCYCDDQLAAFLFIKEEGVSEPYADITPNFSPKKRLKIGTLKVSRNGYKIGERFLRIVFDNAINKKVEEIYVTIFNKRTEQEDLISMLEEWGFVKYGTKYSNNGEELVYVRAFGKNLPKNIQNPKLTFPFFSWETKQYIIRIEHRYHTELFPDSINTKEDASLYQDNAPHRNRLSKVYISHSRERDLKPGDVVLIYKIGETSPKIHSSTLTSICIVESVKTHFKDFEDFYESCNRRTMIPKDELLNDWWNKKGNYKPFIINFLYAYPLPTPKPTLKDLIHLGIYPSPTEIPRGFTKLTPTQFESIVNFAYRKKPR